MERIGEAPPPSGRTTVGPCRLLALTGALGPLRGSWPSGSPPQSAGEYCFFDSDYTFVTHACQTCVFCRSYQMCFYIVPNVFLYRTKCVCLRTHTL